MSQWQPIETAPKDLSAVLIWNPSTAQGKGAVFVGIYMAVRGEGEPSWMCFPSSVRAEPTHWMPIPSPPLPETEGKG